MTVNTPTIFNNFVIMRYVDEAEVIPEPNALSI
jgi:hypothetical protein